MVASISDRRRRQESGRDQIAIRAIRHDLRLRRLLCGMAPPCRRRQLPTNLICAAPKAEPSARRTSEKTGAARPKRRSLFAEQGAEPDQIAGWSADSDSFSRKPTLQRDAQTFLSLRVVGRLLNAFTFNSSVPIIHCDGAPACQAANNY